MFSGDKIPWRMPMSDAGVDINLSVTTGWLHQVGKGGHAEGDKDQERGEHPAARSMTTRSPAARGDANAARGHDLGDDHD